MGEGARRDRRRGPSPRSSASRPTARRSTGPAGFTIDLSKCPAGWSDTEGLTDTEIKIGETGAASGPLADSFSYYKAINAMFDYYSEKGAFKDSTGKTRKVVYIIRTTATTRPRPSRWSTS